jgi:hypothetical protein
MTKKFTKTKIAGILIILGGVGHLLPSLFGTFKIWTRILNEGWWNKIPPPWTSTETEVQKAFWIVWGSFALPFLVLGSLILWLAQQEIKIPKFISFALLAYAFITITLIPTGGMWIFLISAVLLLLDKPKN